MSITSGGIRCSSTSGNQGRGAGLRPQCWVGPGSDPQRAAVPGFCQTVPIGLKPVYLVTEVARCQCRRCEVIFQAGSPFARAAVHYTRKAPRSSSPGGAG